MSQSDDVLDFITKVLSEDKKLILYLVQETKGETPRKKGAYMFISETGETFGTVGGGFEEKDLIEKASELLSFNSTFIPNTWTQTISLKEVCGGNMTIDAYLYVPPFTTTLESEIKKLIGIVENKERVFVFGGGHVGKELVPLLEHIGFDVVVYDDRKEYANLSMHPHASKTICAPYDDIFKHVKIKQSDYIVVMTYGHKEDMAVLKQVLPLNVYYIGCMGSRKKAALTYDFLKDNGFSDSLIKTLNSPIGLDIGADTPAEIAISVASEIIKYRRKKDLS